MQELLIEVTAQVKSALRFRWYGMMLTWAVCAIGWGWVALQPDIYESRARVYVDTSSVLEPLLRNQIVTPNVDTQLSYMREALLGRPTLESVALEVGLVAPGAGATQLEAAIRGLRSQIGIQTTATVRGRPEDLYNISYRSTDPLVAERVVTALLNMFVEDTLVENRRGGATAEQFLDERVAEYAARLERAERALADFKRRHADRLPGSEGDYFVRMRDEQQALELANRDLRVLESKLASLREQLRGESPVVASGNSVDSEPLPNSLDARIRDYRAKLDELLLTYTERHPDVVATREGLDRLLEQRAEQLVSLGLDQNDRELASLSDSPVYQALKVAISETETETATLRAEVSEREAKVSELRGLIDEVPEVEAELARLNRDYEVVYEQYLALVRSRETQELTRKAAATDNVDFRVVDPPRVPLAPVEPARLLLLGAVFVIALGAGGALCFGLSQIWPIFTSAASLQAATGLPVLGTVSHAWVERRRTARSRAIRVYIAALLCLFVAFVGLAGIEVMGPGLRSLVVS